MAARAPSWVKRLYHAAMMLETGGHGIVSELPHGEIVRSLPAYRHMSWNPNEYAAFRAAIRRGDVAVDVGANVGAYSILLGQWVGASGTVFAFEPAPSVFQGLVRHIHLNRVDKVVHPVAQAVGAVRNAALAGPFVYRDEPLGQRRHRLFPNSHRKGRRSRNPSHDLATYAILHGKAPK